MNSVVGVFGVGFGGLKPMAANIMATGPAFDPLQPANNKRPQMTQICADGRSKKRFDPRQGGKAVICVNLRKSASSAASLLFSVLSIGVPSGSSDRRVTAPSLAVPCRIGAIQRVLHPTIELRALGQAALVMGVLMPLGAWGAARAPACLAIRSIDTTQTIDDRTILFRMRDRTVYRNTLPAACTGLAMDSGGFTYVASAGTDEICGSETTIRLNANGIVCQLGDFVQVAGGR